MEKLRYNNSFSSFSHIPHDIFGDIHRNLNCTNTSSSFTTLATFHTHYSVLYTRKLSYAIPSSSSFSHLPHELFSYIQRSRNANRLPQELFSDIQRKLNFRSKIPIFSIHTRNPFSSHHLYQTQYQINKLFIFTLFIFMGLENLFSFQHIHTNFPYRLDWIWNWLKFTKCKFRSIG